jgi:hypothetical protein
VRSRVAILMVSLGAGLLHAEWHQLGAATGRHATVTIVEQSSAGTVFEVLVPGVEVSPADAGGERFVSVAVPGAQRGGACTGRPELPVVPVMLAVPSGARISIGVNVRRKW